MTPVLYSFRRCPYAMRARLALHAAAQTVELREVELRAKPEELRMASPKATVPVLVHDGVVIEQSLDIMLWALGRHDPWHWLPDGAAMAVTLETIAENDGSFKFHLDRYKYPHRFALQTGLENRDAGAAFLYALDQKLREHPFLAGEKSGLLDAAVAPFVRQYAHTDASWFAVQDWLALQHWLQAFESSPAFNAVMFKYPPWRADSTPVITHFAI